MSCGARDETPPGIRAWEALSVGSLVAFTGAGPGTGGKVPVGGGDEGAEGASVVPAVVCGIDGEGQFTVYALAPDNTGAMYEHVPPDKVTQLGLAARRGLVRWPRAIEAAAREAGSGVTVHVLLREACALDGFGGVCLRGLSGFASALRDAAAHLPSSAPAGFCLGPGVPLDVGVAPDRTVCAVLRLLRDAPAPTTEWPRSGVEICVAVDKLMVSLLAVSAEVSRQAAAQALAAAETSAAAAAAAAAARPATGAVHAGAAGAAALHPVDDVATRVEQLLRADPADRLGAMARALGACQRAMDTCRLPPLTALLAGVGVCTFPGSPVALLAAGRVSFAPNLLHIAEHLVEHLVGDGVAGFTVVDVGAGCAAVHAAVYAAVHASGGTRPQFSYRGSNVRNCTYDRGKSQGQSPGTPEDVVLTGVADFVPTSLGLVEPQPGDALQTLATGRLFQFERWTRDGNRAIVREPGGAARCAVLRANVVLPTVVVVAWAPTGEDNFLPQFLQGLVAVRRPLAGMLLLVVGEGNGGCTGDGDPFVHGILSATPSLNEAAFSEWRAQVPGITSKGTLYRVSDVAATLRDSASSASGAAELAAHGRMKCTPSTEADAR